MICEDLSTGFTANVVTRYGDKISKRGVTTPLEYQWYRCYENKDCIPDIYNYKDNILTMEFVEDSGKFDLTAIMWVVDQYKNYPVRSNHTFAEYRQRIADHLAKNPIFGGEKLLHKLEQIDLPHTFAHGDLSVQNILWNKGPILIDPLYGDRFGSYMLDYAKLAFSLKFYKGDLSNYNELQTLLGGIPAVLIASECVRVATYNRNFNFIAENLINEL